MLRRRITGVIIWFTGVISILAKSPVPPSRVYGCGSGFDCWIQVFGFGV